MPIRKANLREEADFNEVEPQFSPNSTQRFNLPKNPIKLFAVVLAVALVAGVGTGYILASTGGKVGPTTVIEEKPKAASQDTKTFRDFAEGTIQKKPEPKTNETYTEGTHLLVRDGAQSVALTSSVVDLTEFEGKKVKVLGETQKALKEGWLMDVGKVETK